MKSNKKITLILIAVIVAALAVSAVIVAEIIKLSKPEEIVITEPLSGDGTGYYRHCYYELNDAEKELYAAIVQGIGTMPEKIPVKHFEGGDFNKVFSAVSLDNPDLFSMGLTSILGEDRDGMYFKPDYTMTYEEYAVRLEQVRTKAYDIANAALQYTSLYERELYVHDYIINNCVYSTQGDDVNSIYGCLINGVASCEGYSRAYQYILSLLNIDNRLITGLGYAADGSSEGHMWNYAVIGGKGYFTDITWDDPVSESGNTVIHKYFNINTDTLLINHADLAQTVPLTTETADSFFTVENNILTYTDDEQLAKAVSDAVFNALSRGYKNVEFKFNDKETLDTCLDKFFSSGILFDAYTGAGLNVSSEDFNVYYSKDEAMLYLCLYF